MYDAATESDLRRAISTFVHDPLGFVLYAFPWGVPGKGLDRKLGPQLWQAQELIALGDALK